MSEVAVPRKRPVPMTPPILNRGSTLFEMARTEGIPDHGDMTVLQLTVEGGVNHGGCCLALERPGLCLKAKILLVSAFVGCHDE